MAKDLLKDIVALCKRRGFIFPGSEIYGGLANTWDYGPMGAELKNNVKREWWKYFIQARPDMVGLDSSILMHPKTWIASGHVEGFSDPLVECLACKKRFRGDQLLEEQVKISAVGMGLPEIGKTIKEKGVKCPECGHDKLAEPKKFNLMFSTQMGAVEGESLTVYLRPETAQGIFVNFNNVLNSTRIKLPFGIGQTGKSFRNEITPKQFIFRTREFEQMEIEYFVKPGTEDASFQEWVEYSKNWFFQLGIQPKNLAMREHDPKELAFYSKRTVDLEYRFPWGFGELVGIASRTDYDLKQHNLYAEEKLEYQDQITNEKFIPYVIEPSFGVDRAVLTFLLEAYQEEKLEERTRTVLKLHPRLAPVKIGIFALKRNAPELIEISSSLFRDFCPLWNVQLDNSGNIGKAYSRQDEIGTPFCVTVDFQTLSDKTVTVRSRDSMQQERISLDQIKNYFRENLD
ncbi:MAG: glycine--tRNA ligase [Candidatus Aureabacteria bacterium]|nr:glycine--tRNA ligase [Candidatus Auribacterota bacterium]